MNRVPLLILKKKFCLSVGSFLRPLASLISGLFPHLKINLLQTEMDSREEEYIITSLVNAIFYFILFSGLFLFLFKFARNLDIETSILMSLIYALPIFLLFFFLFTKYPAILAGKKSEEIEKNLVFALKDLLLQTTSGISIYNAFVHISKENYGVVSEEFDFVIKQMNTGISMENALEKMATRTTSEFLRKVTWQLLNTLKAGASIEGILKTIINEITLTQKARIKDFSHELNLWSMLYMLFAVAVPTIGATMLIILSSFAGFGVTRLMFILFLILCFIVQLILIGFVKSRRPYIQI